MGNQLSCSECQRSAPARLKLVDTFAPKSKKRVASTNWVKLGKHDYICSECWIKDEVRRRTNAKRKGNQQEVSWSDMTEVKQGMGNEKESSSENAVNSGLLTTEGKEENFIRILDLSTEESFDKEASVDYDFEYIARGDDKWLKYNDIELRIQDENGNLTKSQVKHLRKKAKNENKIREREAEMERWRKYHKELEIRLLAAAAERGNNKGSWFARALQQDKHSEGTVNVRRRRRQSKRRRHSKGNRRR